ncbi:MAG TPA: ABC transporter permease [Terriglobales bacterium]|nr:ABC transporter permease [Terriglobales bacterium]
MDTVLKDLRYAARSLAQARGFTIVAVLTLALGIGATTAMFSVVNSVLLRPLPFAEPERLVQLGDFNTEQPRPAIPNGSLSYPDFEDIAARNQSFSEVAGYADNAYTMTGVGEPLHVIAENASVKLFPLLRVQPALGRGFLPNEDDPGHHVAVLSNEFWRQRFNGDKNVLGRTFALNGREFTVIGVMPRGFQFPVRAHGRDMWITFSTYKESTDPKDKPMTAQRGAHWMEAIARLKPGVTLEQANADLTSISKSLAAAYPETNIRQGMAASPVLRYVVGDTRKPLLILMGAVSLVLLIACANVANLLLARSAGRAREIAVRAALGATRGRIIRQLVTESLLLAMVGAVAGIALANWGLGAVLRLYPENLPRASSAGVDIPVLLFALSIAVFTGVLFGLAPALRASSPNLSETMREGGRTSTAGPAHNRVRSALVVAETALGVMLLIGAGLLIRSLDRLSHADFGINARNLLTGNFDLNETRYKADQMDVFVRGALDRIRALPGVISAGGVLPLPMGGDDDYTISFNVLDHPTQKRNNPAASFYVATNGYFETMQIPLVRGRFFDERDQRNSAPVMIITSAFAKKYYPTEDPIGRKIEVGIGEGEARKAYKIREIIGIVGDVHKSTLAEQPAPAYYLPLSQLMISPPTLVVRTAGEPMALSTAVSKVLTSMDPESPLYNAKTMEDCLALDLGRARFQTVLLGVFAAIALLLTAIGLYGVIAYSVAQRTHEIGVRMALGASRGNVLSMVLNRGVQLTFIGIVLGVAGALGLAQIIQALLYEIPPRDPATYFVVCITLGAVALLASYLPALRAARVDPMVALRYE